MVKSQLQTFSYFIICAVTVGNLSALRFLTRPSSEHKDFLHFLKQINFIGLDVQLVQFVLVKSEIKVLKRINATGL